MKISNYLIIAAIAILVGWIKERSKEEYRYAFDKDHNLYIEVFNSGLTGKARSEYLTDSTNFRIYAGTVDKGNSFIVYKRDGDRIYIEKREKVNRVAAIIKGESAAASKYILKTTYKRVYNLTDLKKQHNYE